MELAIGFLIGVVLCFAAFIFMRKTQEDRFKVLAQEVLEKSQSQFLGPFDNKLDAYKNFLYEAQKFDVKERQSVKEQLDHMISSAQRIEKETAHLTKALTSDVKFQGDWGELVLERVLELAGLQEGREFFTQNNFKKEGKTYRPDVMVKLPQNTHIIIDSKVSLKAYFDYLDEPNDSAKSGLRKSLRTHIDSLAAKDYQLLEEIQTPDFIFLFIPVEGVYALILKEFPEILEEAMRKNIVLVSPVNLMANLKTVAALWRLDKQSKSAMEIASKAGAMYDKFALLIDDLEKVETHFKRTQAGFQDIFKKLHLGKGNLVGRAQELKEFGAKTSKEIATDPRH